MGPPARRISGTLELFDAHTHIGANDPDGVRQTAGELIAALERAGARGVVFPMHEPDGYPPANDRVLEAAAALRRPAGRVLPRRPARRRAARRRAAASTRARAGSSCTRGRSGFTLSEPAVRDLIELAHERRVPVLIHAGRGIPALGRDTVRLVRRVPGARLILAHAAISDLAWLWRVLPDHPNLFIDTAWWDPADMMALFTLAPPGNVLWASDSPYGLPLASAVMHMRSPPSRGSMRRRCARSRAGRSSGCWPAPSRSTPGPPPGVPRPLDPLLERVVSHSAQAIARTFGAGDPEESVALARLACAVGDDGPHADVFAAVLRLIDLYEEHLEPAPPGRMFPIAVRLLLAACTVARTPDVALPDF